MSFAEIKEAVAKLSKDRRAELRDIIDAMEEGISVEEFRAIESALEEALVSGEPTYSLAEVRAELKKRFAQQKAHAGHSTQAH